MGNRYVVEVILYEEVQGRWSEDFDKNDVENIFYIGPEIMRSILDEWGFDTEKNCTIVPKKFYSTDISPSMAAPYGFKFTNSPMGICVELDDDEQVMKTLIRDFLRKGVKKTDLIEILQKEGFLTERENNGE